MLMSDQPDAETHDLVQDIAGQFGFFDDPDDGPVHPYGYGLGDDLYDDDHDDDDDDYADDDVSAQSGAQYVGGSERSGWKAAAADRVARELGAPSASKAAESDATVCRVRLPALPLVHACGQVYCD